MSKEPTVSFGKPIVDQDLIDKYKVVESERAAVAAAPNSHLIFENRLAFSVTEAASLIGLSVRSIERAIKRGEITGRRIGRRRLISKVELEAWLNKKD